MKEVGKTTKTFRYDQNQIPYDYMVEVANRLKGLDLTDRELWTDMDCSLPGSSILGMFQARIPEWVAIPLSRGSS